ncbi:MAG: hypothetical protein AAGB04_30520 [Pseudomonadota bacterium]
MTNEPTPRDPYGLSQFWRDHTGYGYSLPTKEELDAAQSFENDPRFVQALEGLEANPK